MRSHLVRGAETVEEVYEREARLKRGGMSDQGEVGRFLDGVRCEQGKAGGPGRHHVAVIAKDG